MSNSKIHIDHLFAKGLENLEIPIVPGDFENIKKEIDPPQAPEIPIDTTQFEDFELAVTDADWQIIKDRLAKEKRRALVPLPVGYAGESFKDFEIAVTDADWQATKSKLNISRKKIIWWWWLNIAVIGSLIGLAAYYFIPSKESPSAISKSIVAEYNKQNDKHTDKNKTLIPNETQVSTENTATGKEDGEYKTDDHSSVQQSEEPTGFKKSLSSSKSPQLSTQSKYAGLNTNSHPNQNNNSDADVRKEVTKVNQPVNNTENTTNADIDKPVDNATATDVVNSDGTGNKVVVTSEVVNSEVNTAVKEKPLSTEVIPEDTTKKAKQTGNTTATIPLPKPVLVFYLGLSTDIARTYRQLSKDNDSTYNAIRNNADQPLTQFNIGVAAGFQKGKNQFQTGIQYTQQTFRSNYSYITYYRDSLPVYNLNGVLIGKFPIGPLKERKINESNHITIKKLDIPFMYNRLWKLDTKTSLITGFGGILSINVKEEGTKMLNPANNQLYAYSYLKGSEQKFGFSPNINLGIQRKLDEHFELQCNTFFKYSVTNRYDTSFTAKEYPYSKDASSFTAKEYLYSYGLSIKLLYLLH